MSSYNADITADAIELQEKDSFCEAGWLKLIAPAKVNLLLAIGDKRPDGYHDAKTVMHGLALHDVVYMRRKTPLDPGYGTGVPEVQLVSYGDVEVPDVSSDQNLASKAILRLRENLCACTSQGSTCTSQSSTFEPQGFSDLMVRIQKAIPFQGGLGGASTDAAAALLGAAQLGGIALDDPVLEQTAQQLGADVAFFLHGGCAYLEGTGDVFVHQLEPAKNPVVLIKPDGGVSTAEAYKTFDQDPVLTAADPKVILAAQTATNASEVPLYNNLASAAERLMPELAEVKAWAIEQPGVVDALLCGSGATTFAVCENLQGALAVVTAARKKGLWARSTSFSSIGAMIVAGNNANGGF